VRFQSQMTPSSARSGQVIQLTIVVKQQRCPTYQDVHTFVVLTGWCNGLAVDLAPI
jgi:hypothetical protein